MPPKKQNPSHWQPGKPGGPGRPKGRLNDTTLEIRQFSQNLFRGLFKDQQYVDALTDRIKRGKESPAVIGLLLAYGFGKPPEKVVIESEPMSLDRKNELVEKLVNRILRYGKGSDDQKTTAEKAETEAK